MQQIFHHYSVFNLSLKRQTNAADWMPDAGVPIVFPGEKKKLKNKKDEKGKEQAKMVFLEFYSMSSTNMSQSMSLEVQGEDAVDVP